MDYLNYGLTGAEALQDCLAHSLLPHSFQETADHRQRHVRLQQRDANFA